jgi:endonuclease/exonuclease/phosphatase family metal-dependent hydrolase
VVSFNYCGNVCASGSNAGAPFVVELVDDSGAEVVLLQEVCRAQAEHLRGALEDLWGRAEVAYVTTFDRDLDGANRCAGDDYGIAVIAPATGHPTIRALPNPGLGTRQLDERTVLCAEVNGFLACTTHLARRANDAAAHDQQVAALVTIALDLARTNDDAVVLAGDLNDEPAAFDELVVGGPFLEAGGGLDQAYATRADFVAVDASERRCPCSDHPALVVSLLRRSG